MPDDTGTPRRKRVCPRCREEHMVSAYARQKGGAQIGIEESARKKTQSWYAVGWYCPGCQHFIPKPAAKAAGPTPPTVA